MYVNNHREKRAPPPASKTGVTLRALQKRDLGLRDRRMGCRTRRRRKALKTPSGDRNVLIICKIIDGGQIE